MPEIIKDGAVVDDSWQLIRELDAALPEGKVIVPLETWQAQADSLGSREAVGVWLASDQPPAVIAADLDKLALVAIDFPKFADGRGFSYARTLREQLGFKGEIRAVGDFMRDQLSYLSRCGVDSFALQSDDLEAALNSLEDFSEVYQSSQDQPLPLFRRR